MSAKLNTTKLQKAISALENNLKAYDIAVQDQLADIIISGLQDGIIQAFEFNYELCWKMMKRWLAWNENPDVVGNVPRKELFRIAAENGLIVDVAAWFSFHAARNQASHIYDSEIAREILETARRFLPYAKDFFIQLEKRL